MPHDLSAAIAATLEHLSVEFDALRTGRANPSLVESIAVEAYGSTMPLVQLASITVPEPRLLLIQPWDASTIKDIEKAISQSSLGINPVVDGKNIRLPFPPMTEQRRKEMAKVVHEKAEEARVRIRTAREDAMKHLKNAEAAGEISEDAATAERAQVQAQVDESSKEILARAAKKEQEILTV